MSYFPYRIPESVHDTKKTFIVQTADCVSGLRNRDFFERFRNIPYHSRNSPSVAGTCEIFTINTEKGKKRIAVIYDVYDISNNAENKEEACLEPSVLRKQWFVNGLECLKKECKKILEKNLDVSIAFPTNVYETYEKEINDFGNRNRRLKLYIVNN